MDFKGSRTRGRLPKRWKDLMCLNKSFLCSPSRDWPKIETDESKYC